MITAIDIAQMRADADGFRTTSVVIYPRTESNDHGSVTEGWSSSGSTILGYLSPATVQARASMAGGKFELNDLWQLSLAYNAAVKAGDKAVIAGSTYIVYTVTDAHDWRPWTKCMMLREAATNA